MSEEDKQQLLKQIFYDPKRGLSSAPNLYTAAKAMNAKITHKDVKDFLLHQSVKQIHLEQRAPKHFFPIKSRGPDHIWCIDLCDTSRDAHHNSGYNWLFCCVDIATRYAWIVPLKNKEASTVTNAFLEILADPGNGHQKPELLMSDNDSAFISRTWKTMIKKENIHMSFADVGDHHKMGIIDAFIKTLRRLVESYRTAYKTQRYIDKIPVLLFNYNNRPHSSLGGSTPTNPNLKKARLILLKKEKRASEYYKPELFAVGSQVRYVLNRNLFEKGSKPRWSVPHKIAAQDGRNFQLDNGNSYKYYQLQPIKGTQEAPPEEEEIRPASPKLKPKKYRLALQKEGVAEENVTRTLRPRVPSHQLISDKGERVLY